jgi:hypothetical protein
MGASARQKNDTDAADRRRQVRATQLGRGRGLLLANCVMAF